jgi:hypothetical protein
MTAIARLNTLLESLGITIRLDSLHDVTPSLLVATLESLLRERLPLSAAARECRTRRGRLEAMKVLLGVLEDDVLKQDMGDIDPRRLAEGGDNEIRLIGEALVDAVDEGLFPKALSSTDDDSEHADSEEEVGSNLRWIGAVDEEEMEGTSIITVSSGGTENVAEDSDVSDDDEGNDAELLSSVVELLYLRADLMRDLCI